MHPDAACHDQRLLAKSFAAHADHVLLDPPELWKSPAAVC